MSLSVLPLIFMAMTLQGDATAPAASPAETVEAGKSPAMVEALANQAQMARGPRLIGEFQPAYSDEQRAAGMLGQGRISIIVTAEGSVSEAAIR